jgi:hypothetical protein
LIVPSASQSDGFDAAAIAVDFAAREGEPLGSAALVAQHRLERDLEQVLQDREVEIAGRAGSGRRERHAAVLSELLEAANAGRAAHIADAIILTDFADEAQMPEVDAEALRIGDRIRNERRAECPQRQAVGRPGVGDRRHRQQRTGAGLVLHHDSRLAGEKKGQVSLHQAGIGIDATAGRHANDEIDGSVRARDLRDDGAASDRERDANHTAYTGEDRSAPCTYRHATFHHVKTLTCTSANIHAIAPGGT